MLLNPRLSPSGPRLPEDVPPAPPVMPTIYVPWNSGGGSQPYDIATFDIPEGDEYIWLVTGLVGISNQGSAQGQAAYVTIFAINNIAGTDQTLAVLTKPPGTNPTGVMYQQVSQMMLFAAGESITLRASAFTQDGSDADPNILRYDTSPDYREGFIIQAIKKVEA